MKSEVEIRRHMQSVRVLMRSPCQCRKNGHEADCVIGGKMMEAVAATLAWALGENEGMQPMVDLMARGARDYIESG